MQSTCCPAADGLMYVKQGVCSCLYPYAFNPEHGKTSGKMRPEFFAEGCRARLCADPSL